MSNTLAVNNSVNRNRLVSPPPATEDVDVLPLAMRIIVTAAVMMATIMEVLDTTIVNVALPDMMGNLGATLQQIGWVSTGYIVANVIILPLTGWLSDYLGRQKYLLYSVVIFTVASLGCGISHSLGEIIIWRIMQGAGGAAFISTAQATLMEIYPPHQRGLAQAVYAIGVILAPTFGPVLGGFLTDRYSWPMIFFVNLPVGITAFILILAFVPDSAVAKARRKADFLGIGLLAIGLGCLQTLLEQGEQYDWFNDARVRYLAIGALIGMALFLWWQLHPKNESPAVNLRILRYRNLSLSCVYAFLMGFMLYGFTFILPQFLQTVQHFTAEQAGIILMPSGIAAMLVMPLIGQLSNRIDKRVLIGAGGLIFTLSMYFFLNLMATQTSADSFFWPLMFRGAGTGLQFVPLSLVALGTLPPAFMADGAGIYNLFRQLGGSFGIAFIVTMIDQREHFHFQRIGEHLNAYQGNVQQFILQMQYALHLPLMPPQQTPIVPPSQHTPYELLRGLLMQQATILTYKDVFYFLLVMSIFSFMLLFFMKKDRGAKKPSVAVH
jgi:DHA2 family multidrug resistance protein